MKAFRKYLTATLLLIGITACNKEQPREPDGNDQTNRKLIEVAINLQVEKFQNPDDEPGTKTATINEFGQRVIAGQTAETAAKAAAKAAGQNTGQNTEPATKAAGQNTEPVAENQTKPLNEFGQRVIASQKTDAMLVQIVENNENTPQTRVPDALDDSYIDDVWVFQYDGTADNAVLIKKDYYTSLSSVKLYAGTNQRVVVLANINYTYGFTDDQVVNTSTYASLLNKTQAIASRGDIYIHTGGSTNLPMSGTVTGNLTEGGSISIPLKRNCANIIFNVKTATTDLNSGTWTYQFCNVPNVNYWVSERADAVFPATVTPINYDVNSLSGMNSSTFTECSAYFGYTHLPTNRRGTVAGTTGKQRKTNAPAGATYMKLMRTHSQSPLTKAGPSVSGDDYVTVTSIYTIHLGANFTNDYNLNPNVQYTYNVTLYSDPNNTDSRVTEYFDYTDNGSPWFGIAKTDAKHSTTAAATMTWYVATGTVDATYNPAPGLSACPAGWRMPTQQELMLMWVFKSSEFGLASSYYWSATEIDYNNGTNAWYVDLSKGASSSLASGSYKRDDNCVRCIRDL